jgi:hypothetical protein
VFVQLRRGIVDWSEDGGNLPSCSYLPFNDALLCSARAGPFARRQHAAAADADLCAVVGAALGAGVLPEDRIVEWRQLDAERCGGGGAARAAQALAATPPSAPVAATGCYTLVVDETLAVDDTLSETFCFGPNDNHATRVVRDGFSTCTATITPLRSSPPWQLEFMPVWHCVMPAYPGRRRNQRNPLTSRRYCVMSSAGELACAPIQDGMALPYARAAGD